jgi:hypothetical protein
MIDHISFSANNFKESLSCYDPGYYGAFIIDSNGCFQKYKG